MYEKTDQLTQEQRTLIDHSGSLFLEGSAGTGKTTVAVQRMLHLLQNGVSADAILVLVPQRTLALPYHHALRTVDLPPGGQVTVTTMSGIAIQMVELFWPLVAKRVGFAPDVLPTFLSLETSQYIMARVIDDLIDEQGYFESVTIDRNRLYSQIIDNLNKAAVVGFPYTEIGERLKAAWLGDTAQNHIFEQVQECANRFRAYCLQHNLLEFSLQMEVFIKHLWRLPTCRDHLVGRYQHLIVDNVEEDNAAAQDILRDWLPRAESALVIYDTEAGYRRFLGSDPDNGYTLRLICDRQVELTETFVNSPDVYALGNELGRALGQYAEQVPGDAQVALQYSIQRYYPEMLNTVADEIRRLVFNQNVPPGEIVVLAPFLSDALRFSLMQRLAGIPTRSHRPSRALREEPASRCLLTLAQLAHPQWDLKPTAFDVAYALMQAIGTTETGRTIDLVRAQLLAGAAYPHAGSKSNLAPFDSLPIEIQERVTYVLGERYDALRDWLEAYIQVNEAPAPPPVEPPKGKSRRKKKQDEPPPAPPEPELDHFFSLIFGEVLSQRGFGFYNDFEAADAAWNLIDSARKFRRAVADKGIVAQAIGREYIEMVAGGVIANQYIREWQRPAPDSVLIAPAYTFLMNNLPVSYQFWLDIGSRGWVERLYQPLTHPYVLSKQWTLGDKWTDEREYEIRRDTLYRIIIGLVRRCRTRVYLGLSELGENGYENQGELLQVFNRMLRRLAAEQKEKGDA
jgi:hypothetical protein